MHRRSAVVTVLALCAALLTVSSPATSVAAPMPSTIAWRACTDPELAANGLQCGSVLVPLDRAHPEGPTIRIALSRKVHTSSTYLGVLLVNPGGPGGSGLSLPRLSDYVPGGAGASYDWIGFDPRGVGTSSPSLHCTRTYFGYDRPGYAPRTAKLTRYWLAKSSSYAATCADTAAKRALLPHLTTLDTVQDIDSIRQALGVETISYYGFSYGTYLGEVYATRYPTRVGRFVLDGVVDPSRVWYAANLDQDRAFDANMNVFWRYLAAHQAAFHLGRKWTTIRRGYYRTLRRLSHKPAAERRLGPDELADVMLDAAYYVYNWPQLGTEYAGLVRHRRGGALLARYRDNQTGDDNSFAMYNAVQCTDTSWPGYARTRADSVAVNRVAPFATWGNTWYNSPCLFWHAPRHTRPTVSGRNVSAKLLLISETHDAATSYSGALATRRLFPTASLVAGVGGTTHASSLSGVACVDNSVAGFLRSGTVPARRSGTRSDRDCPPLLPDPPNPSGRATGGTTDPLPTDLRHDLMQAQRVGR